MSAYAIGIQPAARKQTCGLFVCFVLLKVVRRSFLHLADISNPAKPLVLARSTLQHTTHPHTCRLVHALVSTWQRPFRIGR